MLQNVRNGIDLSLLYGHRMISDAQLLESNGRYLSAIPLYILAYEEIGKGMHLVNKYVRNIRITENEWRKLAASPYAHYQKIAVQYANAINLLSRHSPDEIAGLRTWEKQHGLYFPVPPREFMILKYQRSLAIIKKLPIVKLACYYIDNHNEKWLSLNNYSADMMKDVCTYLYHENMIAYYVAKCNLAAHSLGFKKLKREELSSAMKAYLDNENMIGLKEQRTIIHQPLFIKAREHAFAIIEVISDDYKHLMHRNYRHL